MESGPSTRVWLGYDDLNGYEFPRNCEDVSCIRVFIILGHIDRSVVSSWSLAFLCSIPEFPLITCS